MSIESIYNKNNYRYAEDGRMSSTYNTWRAMKQRCSHPSQKCYKDYGGRGITYCKRWDSFDNFIADMGPKPEGLTLDRINTNGPYEKDNCRWATNSEQQSNKRNNFTIHYKGRTMTITQWSKHLGIPRTTLFMRLKRMRWTTEAALTKPVGPNGRKTG